jgi:Leucine-rich repeat (LRR) protein
MQEVVVSVVFEMWICQKKTLNETFKFRSVWICHYRYDDPSQMRQCRVQNNRRRTRGIFRFDSSSKIIEVSSAYTTKVYFIKIGRVAHLPRNMVEEFPKLTDLSIEDSDIPIVGNNLCGPQFSQIEILYLGECGIHTIKDGAFENLINLKKINLFNNKIRSLGAKVFQKNQKLERIGLDRNKIKILAPGIFRDLNQLISVNLTGNDGCTDKEIGCLECDSKIDHTELNSELLPCYENRKKSLDFLNEGEKKTVRKVYMACAEVNLFILLRNEISN